MEKNDYLPILARFYALDNDGSGRLDKEDILRMKLLSSGGSQNKPTDPINEAERNVSKIGDVESGHTGEIILSRAVALKEARRLLRAEKESKRTRHRGRKVDSVEASAAFDGLSASALTTAALEMPVIHSASKAIENSGKLDRTNQSLQPTSTAYSTSRRFRASLTTAGENLTLTRR